VPVNSWPVPGPWSSAHSTSQQTKHTVENGGKNAEQREKMGRKNLRKKRSPSVEDLLPGQVVLKCVRINFIYWPQNPNRRPPAPCSGLTVSAGVSCSWALGLAY